jgi:group I intron endonuclease
MGVYKITSPTGRVYIGSSKDIYLRWHKYKSRCTEHQKVLYRSFQKHGADSHVFDILEIVIDFTKLFERERYYGLLYKCLVEDGGLNLIIPEDGETPRIYSKETIKRFSEIGKARKYSDETRQKFRDAKIGTPNYHLAKIVLHQEYGIYYESTRQAAEALGLKRTTLFHRLKRGYNKVKIV